VHVYQLYATVAVAAGKNYNLTIKTDGTVWGWGNNINGQLGDGSNVSRNIPVQVSGLAGIIAVAAGEHHSLAIKRDGTAWAWGYN